eukprot:2850569-Amphidinium_carterae.1
MEGLRSKTAHVRMQRGHIMLTATLAMLSGLVTSAFLPGPSTSTTSPTALTRSAPQAAPPHRDANASLQTKIQNKGTPHQTQHPNIRGSRGVALVKDYGFEDRLSAHDVNLLFSNNQLATNLRQG